MLNPSFRKVNLFLRSTTNDKRLSNIWKNLQTYVLVTSCSFYLCCATDINRPLLVDWHASKHTSHHFRGWDVDCARNFHTQPLPSKRGTAGLSLLGLIGTPHAWIRTPASRNSSDYSSPITLNYHSALLSVGDIENLKNCELSDCIVFSIVYDRVDVIWWCIQRNGPTHLVQSDSWYFS